mmetsp:Transcript_37877/g.97751  ORF Transcript_37877/g.97751 Transcript_37877/m.97751 type:complete len:198 (-) Transcript_37877:416-1009(-)
MFGNMHCVVGTGCKAKAKGTEEEERGKRKEERGKACLSIFLSVLTFTYSYSFFPLHTQNRGPWPRASWPLAPSIPISQSPISLYLSSLSFFTPSMLYSHLSPANGACDCQTIQLSVLSSQHNFFSYYCTLSYVFGRCFAACVQSPSFQLFSLLFISISQVRSLAVWLSGFFFALFAVFAHVALFFPRSNPPFTLSAS